MLEAEREASWYQALEQEAAQAGVWMITVRDEGPEGARRGYFATDTDAETNCN